MATFTNIELRKARDGQDLTREQLAVLCHVSASTVENWERGISTPDPDDVDNIARALKHPSMWHDWMMSHYTSYARRYKDMQPYDLPLAVHAARHEINDVLTLQEQAERDALDGRMDDPVLKAKYAKELREMIAGALRVLECIQ